MALPGLCPEGTALHVAGHIQDRWFKTETNSAGKTVRLKTDRHGTGLRQQEHHGEQEATEAARDHPRMRAQPDY